VPAGKRIRTSVAQATMEALASVPVEDVVAADSPEAANIAFDASYTCQTKKFLSYAIRLGTQGSDHYLRITCMGPSAAQVEQSRQIGPQEAKEQLEKKDAILSAADKAQAFNDQHGKWIYKVSKFTAEKLHRPHAELLDLIPASQPAAASEPATSQPTTRKVRRHES
jgi:hypothetical protein